MEGWEVSRYRHRYVRFRGACYALESVEPEPSGGVRYCLFAADPEQTLAVPGQIVDYDAEYVAERDRQQRTQRIDATTRLALWPVLPLLGFLPSGLKLRLHERYGILPETVTAISIWLQAAFLLTFAISALFQFLVHFIPTGLFIGMLVLAPLLYIDLAVRRARLVVPSQRQYGLFEWLVHRLRDAD